LTAQRGVLFLERADLRIALRYSAFRRRLDRLVVEGRRFVAIAGLELGDKILYRVFAIQSSYDPGREESCT
jgi:hypothetical protein